MTDEVFYRNHQWLVIPDFMECSENGYWIGWQDLPRRREDGDYFWHHHMRAKNWLDFDAFSAAFRQAARYAGITLDLDSLDRTERECREYLADWAEFKQRPRKIHGNDGFVSLRDVMVNAAEFMLWRSEKRGNP
jgi:hypothetical protein